MALTTFRKGFSREVKELARDSCSGYCWICTEPGVEVHHRIANTAVASKLYPRFVHSIFNAAYLCRDCHANGNHVLNIPVGVARAYENWLALKGVKP